MSKGSLLAASRKFRGQKGPVVFAGGNLSLTQIKDWMFAEKASAVNELTQIIDIDKGC